MTIGVQVKKLRTRKGWSLTQLSERAGVDSSTVWLIEQGRRNPTAATIRKLAEGLGISVSELLEEKGGPPRPEIFGGVARLEVLRYAHAGATALYVWEETGEPVWVPDELVRHGVIRAVEVLGDCMAPEIEPGDVVIFDAARLQPEDGEGVVVTIDGDGLQVKRAYHEPGEGLILVSNDGTILEPAHATIEGVVLQVIKRFGRKPRPV